MGVKKWDGEVALQISFIHLFILHLFFRLLDLNSVTYIQISMLHVCKAKPSLNTPHSCVTNCNNFSTCTLSVQEFSPGKSYRDGFQHSRQSRKVNLPYIHRKLRRET